MSADSAKTVVVEWLQEAHAMARHGQTMLESRAGDLDEEPDLRDRLGHHAVETARHGEQIETCINDLGASLSKTKDIGGKLSAVGHAWGTRMSGEAIVQSLAASLAFEHFEIANYRALVVVAEMAGALEVKHVCDDILESNQAMANWLDGHLIDVTRRYVERSAST